MKKLIQEGERVQFTPEEVEVVATSMTAYVAKVAAELEAKIEFGR